MSANGRREDRRWTHSTALLVSVATHDAAGRQAFFDNAANANIALKTRDTVVARLFADILAKKANGRVEREVLQGGGDSKSDRHDDDGTVIGK